jgi:ribosome-associated toxin RatA of RatAB toxin-antitoxin module
LIKLITSSGLFDLLTKSYSRQKQEKVIDLEILKESFQSLFSSWKIDSHKD